jgi:hypothetical protein
MAHQDNTQDGRQEFAKSVLHLLILYDGGSGRWLARGSPSVALSGERLRRLRRIHGFAVGRCQRLVTVVAQNQMLSHRCFLLNERFCISARAKFSTAPCRGILSVLVSLPLGDFVDGDLFDGIAVGHDGGSAF